MYTKATGLALCVAVDLSKNRIAYNNTFTL